MRWFTIENNKDIKLPEWACSFGINENGEVFVPAALANVSEKEVYLCTLYDNTTFVEYKKHGFVPSTWLSKEYSKTATICQIIETQASQIQQ